jgi:hypothetical protein
MTRSHSKRNAIANELWLQIIWCTDGCGGCILDFCDDAEFRSNGIGLARGDIFAGRNTNSDANNEAFAYTGMERIPTVNYRRHRPPGNEHCPAGAR